MPADHSTGFYGLPWQRLAAAIKRGDCETAAEYLDEVARDDPAAQREIEIGRNSLRSGMKRLALVAPLALIALAGCDLRPAHAEWQMRCVESHTEMQPMTQAVSDGKGGTTIQIVWLPADVCDREAPVCIGGKDGSTRCQNPKGTTA